MSADNTIAIVSTLTGLITVLVGVLAVTPVVTLSVVVLIVRSIRHNPALEQSIRALYNSVPAPIQRDIAQVGSIANEVSGLLSDISTGTIGTSSTVIAAQTNTTTTSAAA